MNKLTLKRVLSNVCPCYSLRLLHVLRALPFLSRNPEMWLYFTMAHGSIKDICPETSVLKGEDWTSLEKWTQRSLEGYFCPGDSAVSGTMM